MLFNEVQQEPGCASSHQRGVAREVDQLSQAPENSRIQSRAVAHEALDTSQHRAEMCSELLPPSHHPPLIRTPRCDAMGNGGPLEMPWAINQVYWRDLENLMGDCPC